MGTLSRRMVAWLALVVGLLAVTTSSGGVRADHAGPDQVPGYDISWPQCNKEYPKEPIAYAIIGMNNGRPFTANPCFEHQYRWAQKYERNPSVYINTDFPRPGRAEGDGGPFGMCAANDDWCRAYNYGYNLARDVHSRATALSIAPKMWWLDVETGNYWLSGFQHYNAQVLQGAVWYFKERQLPLGIYGTSYQWGLIAGSYAPGLPLWVAGAQGVSGASKRCSNEYAFGGGHVVMVQYYDFGFDTNYECAHGHTQTGKVLPHQRSLPMLAN